MVGLPSGVGRLCDDPGLDEGGSAAVDAIHGSNSELSPVVRTLPKFEDAVLFSPTVVGTEPMVPAKIEELAVSEPAVPVLTVGIVTDESTELALAESSLLDAGSKVILGGCEPDGPGWDAMSDALL